MSEHRNASLPAFLSKEWRESFRQSRALIIVAPMILFAILDPIMLKLLPKILASQAPDLGSLMKIDWAQAIGNYFKDLSQLCLFVFILATMGTIAEERTSGAYLIIFSRRVQRWQLPVAKFLVTALIIAVGMLAGGFVARYYVGVLFPGPLAVGNLLLALAVAFVYYLFILGLLLCLSALFKRGFAAGIATLVTAMLLPLAGYIPGIGHYLPHVLISAATAIVVGGPAAAPSGIWVAVAVAAVLAVAGVAGAGLALERAEQ